jgi:hypothetical protein
MAAKITTTLNGSVMVSTISSAAPPVQIAAAGNSASSSQQIAALKQLLARYTLDQSRDAGAAQLPGLGRQIMAMAKSLDQHVTLPRVPTAMAATAAPGKVSLSV